MTTETIPNENVQTVLDDLEARTGNEPTLTWHDGNRMDVQIDMRQVCSEYRASLVHWLLDHNWIIDDIDMERMTVTMAGPAYDVP